MFDVVGMGTVAVDIVKNVNELPKADGFAIIKDTNFLPGGSGTNVITQASRLNAKCAYIAQIGDDNVGDVVLQSLKDEKVDTQGMVIKENGVTIHTDIILDDTGDKFILLNMGDAFLSLDEKEVDYSLLEGAKVYFTDLLPGGPAISGLKKAKELGLKTIVNMQINLATMTGLGVNKDMILEALSYIDVFAPCREGFYDLCETTDIDKAKDYIRQYFKGTLIVTLGAEGSVAYDEKDNKITVPIQKTKVIDTTGAGDSYLGAFIYKYFVDEDSLKNAMEFATKCASFTCQSLGARACPTHTDIN